jgi:uncharacterized damage-inducible protein DinB
MLQATRALTSEERIRDLGLSHRSVLETFNHVYDSERFWTNCLRSHTMPPMDQIGTGGLPRQYTLPELEDLWPRVWADLEGWLTPLSEEDFACTIRCRLSPTREMDFTRFELVRHMVNHSTLHRGQVISMLRMLGKQPPSGDIMGYYLSR